MPAIVSEHQHPHFIPNDTEQEMIAKHPEPRPANVIFENTEARRMSCDPVFRRLHLRKKSVSELGATLPIEVIQGEAEEVAEVLSLPKEVA